MNRSFRQPVRRSRRSAVAATIALSLAVNAAPAVADPAPAPLNQQVVIGGVKMQAPAALAAAVGIAAALGGIGITILSALTNGFGSSSLPGSSNLGSASPKPSDADPAVQTAEYVNRFDFGAVSTEKAIGGLSGIEYVGNGRYIAISDDKNEHGPIRAYYFQTRDLKQFEEDGMVTLTNATGAEYAEFTDAEEIRLLPNGNLLWTTEGDAREGQVVPPQLIESKPDGKEVRRIDMPEYHVPDGKTTRGIYHNNGPEAMALMPGGKTAVTINENALAQDGQANSPEHRSLSRVTFFDLKTGQPSKEYAVRVDGGRGVTSVIAGENGELYMLERGFFEELGENGENRAEIYRLDLTGAENVLGKEALDGSEATVGKQKIFDFAAHPPHPDNVEGLAWGPVREDGRRTMIVVSDDNFNDTQTTLFHTLLLP